MPYGTRGDHLPAFLARVVRSARADRLLEWSGRPGVHLLDHTEHHHHERESLNRFPWTTEAAIDWSAVPDLVLGTTHRDSPAAIAMANQWFTPAPHVILIWQTPLVPTVRVDTGLFLSHLAHLLESTPEFWAYSPTTHTLLESAFSGQVTLARIPPEPQSDSRAAAARA
ncbi:hypothetical protein [Actinokineospora globicatena]|uniref:hypothetical protein n=1 Tax=Actinokineospora globicatena TaxID=103729 RepID=UPI0020A2A3AD|nr:hypothetical protein [Actinokineospora globicatena]MCP2303232.1 hypothetical protein [Actinokineospora globicatena]GLW79642.1 hypothetical protein Aglo01_41230 [Actinokineospora globicatena]GLW85948.1 hypothetical protein Aglo02_35880 [Actinokineospora globicatena]